MLFRYKIKKCEDYLLHEYVVHYKITIQAFYSKKSKWKYFDAIDLGKLLLVNNGTAWDNRYLIDCVEALKLTGGIDSLLKDHIKTVMKENYEINMETLKIQEAIANLDKMFASNKAWTVIELEFDEE